MKQAHRAICNGTGFYADISYWNMNTVESLSGISFASGSYEYIESAKCISSIVQMD